MIPDAQGLTGALSSFRSLDRPGRWQLVARLIDHWFKAHEGPQRGYDPSEIAAAEHTLGVALPAALCDWYLGFGKLTHVWSAQDRLMPPGELRRERGRIVIARENQNVVQWSIAASTSELDPQVLVSDDAEPETLHVAAKSVTELALQMLVLGAKFSEREDLFRANGPVTDAALAAIEQQFPRIPFADLHWPPFPTRIYGDERLLLEVDSATWLWLTARDGARFDHARQLAERAGVTWEALERPR